MAEAREFVMYINGQIMPQGEGMAALQSTDMQSAGGFYDHERTFNGQVFKLPKHLERLYNGLNHTKIEPGIGIQEMEALSMNILEANLPLRRPDGELELTQIVSLSPSPSSTGKPNVNVVIYCKHLDFPSFALGYAEGVKVATPVTYGVPEQLYQPGYKGNRHRIYPLMSTANGSITECKGGNFMFVQAGRIKLPDRRNVLPGISMHTVLELAQSLGVEIDEDDYSPFDVYQAEEAFITNTLSCLQPVAVFNGLKVGSSMPGPLTLRLWDAWRELVQFDFVQQGLDHLPLEGPAKPQGST